MSLSTSDAETLEDLLRECQPVVFGRAPGQTDTVSLTTKFSLEAFERIRDPFMAKLEEYVSNGDKSVHGLRVVDADVVAAGNGLRGALYFVRYLRRFHTDESAGSGYEILFELNPYRRVLNVGVAMRSEEAAA